MSNWLSILLLAVSVVESAAGAMPQTQGGATSGAAGTVYFYYSGYESHMPLLRVPSIEVLVDGQIVATMKQRTYVGVRVAPGRHAFGTKSRGTNPKETTIELDIASGQQVFIRLNMLIARMGIVKWTAFPRVVDHEEGRVTLTALQPLDARNVDDKARVTTEAPRPPREAPAKSAPEAVRFSAALSEEPGIYIVSASTLQRLTPEITTFRTTSVYGLTANLKNLRSTTRLKPPLEFVIRSAEGTSVAEYVLVQMMTRGDRREYRTLDGGKSGVRQGPERMAVPFESRRIDPNTYYVTIVAVPRVRTGGFFPGPVSRQLRVKERRRHPVRYASTVDGCQPIIPWH